MYVIHLPRRHLAQTKALRSAAEERSAHAQAEVCGTHIQKRLLVYGKALVFYRWIRNVVLQQ
jgi:hypothetical protein